jgi:hypothetical protein
MGAAEQQKSCLRRSTTHRPKELGIGLALVKDLVNAMAARPSAK